MPGPFPGMDPYLEDPVLWPGIHQRLITYIADSLSESLPDRYVANLNERIDVDEPDQARYPDAAVVRTIFAGRASRGNPETAGAVVADPPLVLEAADEIREGFVEILPAREPDRVVAVIELLSPSNKAAGSSGRTAYLAKQREILASPAHLIEIDLLRAGEHTIAAPKGLLARRSVCDYVVCLCRADRRGRFEVWPVTVRRRLPRVAVPLLDDDADVVLALQPLFDRCFDLGTYLRRLDYNGDPVPR